MRRAVACAALVLAAAACDRGNPNDPSQVIIEFAFSDLAIGTGGAAATGNRATIAYTVWLYNPAGTDSKGNRVQSSTDAGIGSYSFTLGARQALPGIDQGTTGMRVGGKRRVYVPASLAYGSQGSQAIPPDAALVFEVELLNLVQ